MEIQPLTGAVGARISGLDCAQVSPTDWDVVLETFHTRHVLVFAGQSLNPYQHMAFMERFGELDIHPQELSARTTLPLPENPKIELMANKPGHYGPRASAWHTDVTFCERPPAVTSLYGIQTPVGCADTIWTNMRAVYDDCTDGLKTTLRSLNAVHATAFVQGSKHTGGKLVYDPTIESHPLKTEPKAQYRQEVEHPIVHAHEAGFETLYINPSFVNRIAGWSLNESKPLLDALYARAAEPRYMYRHQWAKGDLVVWDNRCLMHYGVNDYTEHDTRVLHRTTGCPFDVSPSR